MAKLTRTPIHKNFSTDWFKDLGEGDDKELRRQLIQGSSNVMELLLKIITQRKESLDRKYDYQENWQFDLAKDLGRKQELDYIIKLLTPIFDKE